MGSITMQTGPLDEIQLVAPEQPDRLPAMLFLAALIHGILIIGVTFNAYVLDDLSNAISLEVTIVADPDQQIDRPDEAEYLVPAISYPKVQGLPFRASEIEARILELTETDG